MYRTMSGKRSLRALCWTVLIGGSVALASLTVPAAAYGQNSALSTTSTATLEADIAALTKAMDKLAWWEWHNRDHYACMIEDREYELNRRKLAKATAQTLSTAGSTRLMTGTSPSTAGSTASTTNFTTSTGSLQARTASGLVQVPMASRNLPPKPGKAK